MRQKIFLILWLIALCVSSQTIKINDVPDWDKIPVKVIHRMYQDHRGFIWYGTFGGLFRYDGYAIKAYRSDFKTPDVFSSNYITNIREDKDVLFLLKKRVRILFYGCHTLKKTNQENNFEHLLIRQVV